MCNALEQTHGNDYRRLICSLDCEMVRLLLILNAGNFAEI